MSMRKNNLFEEKKHKQKKHFSTSVQFPPLKSMQELRQASFAVIKETGECCGFCPTPEQVDEQPSLVFRTTLLKADDPDVQCLKVT